MMEVAEVVATWVAYAVFVPFLGGCAAGAGWVVIETYNAANTGTVWDAMRRYGLLAATGFVVMMVTGIDF